MLTSPLLAIVIAPSLRQQRIQQLHGSLFFQLTPNASHSLPLSPHIPYAARDKTLYELPDAPLHTDARLPPSRPTSPSHFQTRSALAASLPSKSSGNVTEHELPHRL